MILSSLFQETRVVKLFSLSVAFFFMLYSVVCGFFWTFDSFGFLNVLTAQIVLEAVALALVMKKHHRKLEIKFDLQQDCWPIILMLILLPFTISKFELFSTGQDQGLYQAEAIELYMGNYDVQHDLEEYLILQDENDKDNYKKMVENFTGFYPLRDRGWPTVHEDDVKSDVSGMYHGVQTFPSMLGLWAKMFGVEKMAGVQTVFYLCSVILFYYLLVDVGIKRRANVLLTTLFGLSPLVLWISKSSFTEMFLTLIMVTYLLLLWNVKPSRLIWLQAIPLISFAYIHVSFIVLLPAFVVVNLYLYASTKKLPYLYVNVLCAMGLSSGYYMMSVIAPQYFFDNCARLYWRSIVTRDNFMLWVYFLSMLIVVVSFLVYRLSDLIEQLFSARNLKKIFVVLAVVSLFIMVWKGIKIGFMKTPEDGDPVGLYKYYGTGLAAFSHLSLYAFAMSTGFIIVPYVVYLFIRRTQTIIMNRHYVVVGVLFLYMIMIQSAVIRTEVQYYYYYSRYLVFYIPIILLLFAVYLQDKVKRMLCICFLSLIPCLLFDIVFLKNKDHTVCEWEILLDMSAVIEENSAIIIGNAGIGRDVALQLRTISDSAIFPVFEDFEKELNMLKSHYDHIYYLTNNSVGDTDEVYLKIKSAELRVSYKDSYMYSSEAVNSGSGIYPTEMVRYRNQITLYQLSMDQPIMSFDIRNPKIIARNGEKGASYIESNGNEGIVMFGPYCSLPAGEYILRIPIQLLDTPNPAVGGIRSWVGGQFIIAEEGAIKKYLVDENNETYIEMPFELSTYQRDIEFVITAAAGSKFRIYSYDIYEASEYDNRK